VQALVSELESDRDLALVFVRTKRGADRLVKRLGAQGVDALAMHGNKSQRQREIALARFESGKVSTLVATDVAARGIDISGISHVINFDAPGDHDSYVHRVGRTGRAGRQGVAITLVGRHEQRELAGLADHLGIAHDLGPAGAPNGSGRAGNGAAPSRRRKPSKGSRPGASGGHQRPSRSVSGGSREAGSSARRRRRQGAGRRSGTPAPTA
jgi:superfamily II DNA/RNA helicase